MTRRSTILLDDPPVNSTLASRKAGGPHLHPRDPGSTESTMAERRRARLGLPEPEPTEEDSR